MSIGEVTVFYQQASLRLVCPTACSSSTRGRSARPVRPVLRAGHEKQQQQGGGDYMNDQRRHHRHCMCDSVPIRSFRHPRKKPMRPFVVAPEADIRRAADLKAADSKKRSDYTDQNSSCSSSSQIVGGSQRSHTYKVIYSKNVVN